MSKTSLDTCIVFAGPTLFGIDNSLLESHDYTITAPVKRGDIERLVNECTPATIAIVDGVFHAHPAVGHAEILEAMAAGWRVWGLSSMGAIRACEMCELGMLGFGEVYRRFATDPNFSDDEVTLVHQMDSPFIALSEPLIHIRYFLDSMTQQNIIPAIASQKTISHMKNMWYGQRTLSQLKITLGSQGVNPAHVELALENFQDYRLKTLDLENFLKLKPWTRTAPHNATFNNFG